MFRKVLVGLLLVLIIITVGVWRLAPLTVNIGTGVYPLTGTSLSLIQGEGSGGGGLLRSLVTNSATTAGNILIAYFANTSGSSPHVVAMPAGWTQLIAQTQGTQSAIEVWIYPNNPGGILTVPVTVSPLAGWSTEIDEWYGVARITPLETSGAASATSGTSLTLTTSGNILSLGDLAQGAWIQRIAGAATVVLTVSAGWADENASSGGNSAIDHFDYALFGNPATVQPLPPPVGAPLTVTMTSDHTTTSAVGVIFVLTPAHTATDETAYLQFGSVTEKQNTADFSLLLGGKYELEDGSGGYLLEDGSGYYLLDTYVPQLGDPVAFTNPTWNGRVVDVTKADLVDRLTNYQLATIAATNQTVAGVTSPPGDFADVLTGGKYELEDGSGGYLLEDGSGYYLLEGTSFSYRGLSVKSTQNIDGSVTTYGMLTAFEPGFAAGQTFNLTNANLGYVAQPFLITNVTTTFVGANPPTPEYLIEFGSAYLTLQTSGGGVLTTLGTQAATQAGIVSPGGTLGYAQVTANQGTFTAITDLTGLTVTVTVAAGRRIKITGEAALGSSVSTDTMRLYIRETGTTLQFSYIPGGPATCLIECDLTPSAGVHTYNLSADRNAGSGNITMFAGATQPAFVKVEDIGT